MCSLEICSCASPSSKCSTTSSCSCCAACAANWSNTAKGHVGPMLFHTAYIMSHYSHRLATAIHLQSTLIVMHHRLWPHRKPNSVQFAGGTAYQSQKLQYKLLQLFQNNRPCSNSSAISSTADSSCAGHLCPLAAVMWPAQAAGQCSDLSLNRALTCSETATCSPGLLPPALRHWCQPPDQCQPQCLLLCHRHPGLMQTPVSTCLPCGWPLQPFSDQLAALQVLGMITQQTGGSSMCSHKSLQEPAAS